ncbi:MAG: hypothetical protein HYV02_08130 [Deltaproteobacteria bacterium]|nr:hypothetical protein [Deltaproteobacteria bacterium]
MRISPSQGVISPIALPATLPLPSGHTSLLVHKAVYANTAAVAALIRAAFSYWPQHGVNVSPASQTDEKTWAHLVRGGYVFVEAQEPFVPLATVTVYPIDLAFDSTIQQWNLDTCDESTLVRYIAAPNVREPADPVHYSMVLFEKLAVQPELAHRGIGTAIYRMIEEVTRRRQADGLAIETVAEAAWLCQWYHHSDFARSVRCATQGVRWIHC